MMNVYSTKVEGLPRAWAIAQNNASVRMGAKKVLDLPHPALYLELLYTNAPQEG